MRKRQIHFLYAGLGSAAFRAAVQDVGGRVVGAKERPDRAVETANVTDRILPGNADVRGRNHGDRIGVIAETENAIAGVIDGKIVDRGNVDLSDEGTVVQGDGFDQAGLLPHYTCGGDGNVGGGTVGGDDEALGQTWQRDVANGGFAGIVDDSELIVGGLRADSAEDEGETEVGREDHHAGIVAGGDRGDCGTNITEGVDNIDAGRRSAGTDAIGDEGAIGKTAGSGGGGGTASAAETDETRGQHK